MSKAVLLLDEIPGNCWDCPIVYDFIECSAKGRRIPDENKYSEDYDNEHLKRPAWCPLHPLPKRKPVDIRDSAYYTGLKKGFNDCLGQIEWEAEDG